MGSCMDCFSATSHHQLHESQIEQDDPDERRKKQAEAAERRQKEMEGKGIKDPEGLKRKQKKRQAIEKQSERMPQTDGLKWTVG